MWFSGILRGEREVGGEECHGDLRLRLKAVHPLNRV
jgi:hypothetical protein